jgi:hypothetical protein
MSDNPWDAFSRSNVPAKRAAGPPRWIIEKHQDERSDTYHGEKAPANAVSAVLTCLHCSGDIYWSKLAGTPLHWRNARRYCRGNRGKTAQPDNIEPLFEEPPAKRSKVRPVKPEQLNTDWFANLTESTDDPPPF